MVKIGRFSLTYGWKDIPQDIFIHGIAPYLELEKVLLLTKRRMVFSSVFAEQTLKFPEITLDLLLIYPEFITIFVEMAEGPNGRLIRRKDLNIEILLALSLKNPSLLFLFHEQASKEPWKALGLLAVYPEHYLSFKQIFETFHETMLLMPRIGDIYEIAVRNRNMMVIGKLVEDHQELYLGSIMWYDFIGADEQETLFQAMLQLPVCTKANGDRSTMFIKLLNMGQYDKLIQCFDRMVDFHGYVPSNIYKDVWDEIMRRLSKKDQYGIPPFHLVVKELSSLICYMTSITDNVQ